MEGWNGVDGVGGVAKKKVGRGGKGWEGYGGNVLIHSSVQTASMCPSPPSPFLTKCRLAATAACTWRRVKPNWTKAKIFVRPWCVGVRWGRGHLD